MTELRINGHERVRNILRSLLPFLKFKKKQTTMIMKSADLLLGGDRNDVRTKKTLVSYVLIVQGEHYATRAKRSEGELKELLGLTP